MKFPVILLIITVLCCLALMINAYGATFTDHEAILAILGEAEGEGYPGMEAVAHAIRNRGTLNGVYGAHKHKRYSSALWQTASRAWAESEYNPDPTFGATHWENIATFGTPSWARHMMVSARIGHHVFYKEMK